MMRRTKGLTDDDEDTGMPPVRPPTRSPVEAPQSMLSIASGTTMSSSEIPLPPPPLQQHQRIQPQVPAVTTRERAEKIRLASSPSSGPAELPPPPSSSATSPREKSGTTAESNGNGASELSSSSSPSSSRPAPQPATPSQVRNYMQGLFVAPPAEENVPLGAVPVQGMQSRSNENMDDPSHWDNVGEPSERTEDPTLSMHTDMTPQVVAQLAPDDDDMAARVALQLQQQISSEWQARLKEEVQAQLNTHRQSHVVVEAVSVGVESPSSSTSGLRKNRISEESDDFLVCGFQRRTCGFILLALLVACGAIGGVAAAVLAGGGDDDTTAPTSAPTIVRTLTPTRLPTMAPTDAAHIRRAYLLETLGPRIAPNDSEEEWALFEDSSTPQAQAIQWMSESDSFSSQPQEIKAQILLERYALAVLYYSTSGSKWSSNPSFLDGDLSVCEWNNGGELGEDDTLGAFCDDSNNFGSVTYLDLHQIRLKGAFPWEITFLESLMALYMENNSLTGSLPSQFGDLSDLRYAWLHGNSLTGQVPEYMPVALETILLTDNYLSGTLASEWATTMPNIVYLAFGQNQIQGTIPPELGDLEQLTYWDMEGSSLTGSIPTTMGLLTNLEYLYFEKNDLQGTLPSELGELTNLVEFLVYGNVELIGSVPEEMSNLTNLEYFQFEDTSLTGSVDSIFCTMGNDMPELRGDCLGNTPEIECTCCAYCCASDGSSCQSME